MFLQFQLKGIKALKIRDNRMNPFDRDIEVFQTWQIFQTEDLVPGEDPKPIWTRSGYSVTGASEDGVRFIKGESRTDMYDPTISFRLPELEPGKKVQYEIDIHFWESDSGESTKKIRALYSNEILKFLAKAYENANEDQKAAEKELLQYLDKNKDGLINLLSNAATVISPSVPWIKIAQELYPVITKLAKLISANATDYIGVQTFWLEIRNNNGNYEWRFFSNDLGNMLFDWQTANGKLLMPSQTLTDAEGGISLQTTFQGVMHD